MNKKETKQNEAKTEEKVAPPAPVAEEQVEALTKEVLHWKDLALRTAAEMENLRKRCQIDMQNTAKYANKDFAKDILPVVDNLENAMKHTRVEIGKSEQALPPFVTGLFQGGMNQKLLGFFSGFPTRHFPADIVSRLREELSVRESLVFVSAWPSEYEQNDADSTGMHGMFAECQRLTWLYTI